MALELTCTNEEKIPITINPVTPSGKPAEIDGEVLVSVISGEGTYEMIDENSFYVISGDFPGATTYLIEADADIGEGVVNISDTITLNVEGALAKNLGLVAGTPELK